MPVSRTEHLSWTFSPVRSTSSMLTPNLAALGELHGVVDQVGQDLSETQRVADEMLPESPARRATRNSRPLSWAFCAVSVVTELITSSSLKSVVSMSSLPASIFEKSRMSLMMASSEVPAFVDLADVVALLRGVSVGLERQMRQADDGVHRRADLVAHVREEHRLHFRGFFRLALRTGELRRLGLELTRLLPGLPEQLLGSKVALQDLQAHGDNGQ